MTKQSHMKLLRSQTKKKIKSTKALSKQTLIDRVEDVIEEDIVEDILNYLRETYLKLMGEKQPRSYLKDMMYLTLYHDISGIGYNKLLKLFRLGYSIGNASITTNTHRTREELRHWAKDNQILIGNLSDEWNAARSSLCAASSRLD